MLVVYSNALTITSVDNVDISTKDSKNATSWDKLESGSIADLSITKPTSIKLTVSDPMEKEKIESIIQISSNPDIIVKADEKYETVNVISIEKDRIEAYYSYGKSSTYPWGIYWCVNDIGGKPVLIYSEFSGRKVWFAPIGQKTIDTLTASLEKGELPDITVIQAAVGA